jgi:GntR family transcriptional regulator
MPLASTELDWTELLAHGAVYSRDAIKRTGFGTNTSQPLSSDDLLPSNSCVANALSQGRLVPMFREGRQAANLRRPIAEGSIRGMTGYGIAAHGELALCKLIELYDFVYCALSRRKVTVVKINAEHLPSNGSCVIWKFRVLSVTESLADRNHRRFSPRGVPLHRQLFLVLRDQITSGLFKAGEALPKEEVLCEQFNVSRITVRRAINDLRALGLIERRHALGTFVRHDVPLARPIPSLSFVGGLRKSAEETKAEVLECTQTVPPAVVSALLGLARDVQALRVYRRRTFQGRPVMIVDSWIPLSHSRGIDAASLKTSALYDLLLAQGVEFGRMVQEISASVADPEKAKLMNIEIGAPLLKVTRVMHDAADKPVQFLIIYLSPDRSRILTEIPGDWINTLNPGQIVHDPQ